MGKGALRIALQEGLGKMPDLTCNGQRSKQMGNGGSLAILRLPDQKSFLDAS